MNSTWTVQLADTAKKQLTKLAKKNPQQAKRILDYLKELQRLENPRDRGKGLVLVTRQPSFVGIAKVL